MTNQRQIEAMPAVQHAAPSLSFGDLRAANIRRLPEFKNRRGGPAHSKPDGSDWSPSDWLRAVVGEIGELANLQKKVQRGDFDPGELPDIERQINDEFADVVIYLDLFAFRCGVDLSAAVIHKFNAVSMRVGSTLRICEGGWFRDEPPHEPELVFQERCAVIVGPELWARLRVNSIRTRYRMIVMVSSIDQLGMLNCERVDLYTCPHHPEYTDNMGQVANEAMNRGATLTDSEGVED